MNNELIEQIKAMLEAGMSIDEINAHQTQITWAINSKGRPEFEGYSPIEMKSILYDAFGSNCAVRLNDISASIAEISPMFLLVKDILERVEKEGELKLTKNLKLPVALVSELYQKGYYKEYMIENGISKLYKEESSFSISLAHILVQESAYCKLRNGKLSLTAYGKKNIANHNLLLQGIVKWFFTRYNWGYFDGHGDEDLAKIGACFSCILVSKYGDSWRKVEFYADKYFTAFPYFNPSHGSIYSFRTFDHFMDIFGFIESKWAYSVIKEVKKTELFKSLFDITAPGI